MDKTNELELCVPLTIERIDLDSNQVRLSLFQSAYTECQSEFVEIKITDEALPLSDTLSPDCV